MNTFYFVKNGDRVLTYDEEDGMLWFGTPLTLFTTYDKARNAIKKSCRSWNKKIRSTDHGLNKLADYAIHKARVKT